MFLNGALFYTPSDNSTDLESIHINKSISTQYPPSHTVDRQHHAQSFHMKTSFHRFIGEVLKQYPNRLENQLNSKWLVEPSYMYQHLPVRVLFEP